MLTNKASLVGAVFACLGLAQSKGPAPAASRAAEQDIRNTEKRWLQSYVMADAITMERIEADEFRIVYPNGVIVTKAEELAGIRKAKGPRPELRLYTEDETVRLYGNTAVAMGNFIQSGRYEDGPGKGQSFRIVERYTDVWVRREGRWQVVASQLTAIEPKNGS